MTMEVKPFEGFPKLLADFEALAFAKGDIVFRGHQQETWKIESTYSRHTKIPHESWDSSIDEILSHFIGNKLTIDPIPFPATNRRARLEYGRHYGVPTPVVDYSHSPFIALYFAFNDLDYRIGSPSPNASVYALNLQQLGTCWANIDGSIEPGFGQRYSDFRWERPRYFEHGYPGSELKFVPLCASWNARMRNQLGCFIYDTLDYKTRLGCHGDFEGWVDNLAEPRDLSGGREPTLTKFLIPHSEAANVFSRLELMNITGTKLLDRDGMVSDVKNASHYIRKTGGAWDLALEPPDDTRM
jgi:hypothetical protein